MRSKLARYSYIIQSLALLMIPGYLFCQSPKTDQVDIWLLNVKSENGHIRFNDPKNITHQMGYENQPCYSSDGKYIYYTAKSDTSIKTTIYSYDIASGNIKQVTFTQMSPYSPTPSPIKNGISVLMVEGDSSQRIWQYPFSGSKPYPLLSKHDSIGYYAWVDQNSAIVYILAGKNSPNRLSLIKEDGTERKLAENIGRGMKVLDKGAFFIQKDAAANYLSFTDYSTTKRLVRTPGNSEFLAIYKDFVLMASGGTIYGARMKKDKGAITGVEEFTALQDLSPLGLKQITRMAISPDETKIALAVGMQ